MKSMKIKGIFEEEAQILIQARQKAIKVHGTGDIKAAGNEIEEAVRDYLRRSLPSRFHVTHGHLIDVNGVISPQLDVIISDNEGIPSLFKTADGTSYVPATSAYAVGEIKSTFYRNKNYLPAFQKTLNTIAKELQRPIIENSAFGDVSGVTDLMHLRFARSQKTLNALYSFLICIDRGDFEFGDIASFLCENDPATVPHTITLLGTGSVFRARKENGLFHIVGSNFEVEDCDWYFSSFNGQDGEVNASNHLADLYANIMSHLACSQLGPINADLLVAPMRTSKTSDIQSAKKINQ